MFNPTTSISTVPPSCLGDAPLFSPLIAHHPSSPAPAHACRGLGHGKGDDGGHHNVNASSEYARVSPCCASHIHLHVVAKNATACRATAAQAQALTTAVPFAVGGFLRAPQVAKLTKIRGRTGEEQRRAVSMGPFTFTF